MTLSTLKVKLSDHTTGIQFTSLLHDMSQAGYLGQIWVRKQQRKQKVDQDLLDH